MKFRPTAVAFFFATICLECSTGFSPQSLQGPLSSSVASAADVDTMTAASTAAAAKNTLTVDFISKLRFRQVQKELELRQLDTTGTLTDMKQRLRHIAATVTSQDVQGVENAADPATLVIDDDALNMVRIL